MELKMLLVLVLVSCATAQHEEPQELSRADLQSLLGGGGLQRAAAAQHRQDSALLQRLSAAPGKHRCWCSTIGPGSAAQIQAEQAHAKLEVDREQIAEARREAGAALEQLKAQEKRLSESREPARPTGQCDECEKRMLGMQIELRVAQMKAEQLEEELDKLRKEKASA